MGYEIFYDRDGNKVKPEAAVSALFVSTDKNGFAIGSDYVILDKKKHKQKALSPRNIPASAAINAIRQIEEKFLAGIMGVYDKGITDIIKRAQSQNLSRKQLEKEVADYNRVFVEKATEEAEAFAMDAYEAGLLEELTAMGIEREERFAQPDLAAIELLKERPDGLFSTLKTFDKDQTEKLREVIARAYETPGEFDRDKMVKEMAKVVDTEKYKLERIARSETTKISNTARKVQWEQYADPNKKEYHWIEARAGSGKGSACEICSAIAHGGTVQVKKGVNVTFPGNPYTLPEIEEATSKFLPHPFCKCTVVRMPFGESED